MHEEKRTDFSVQYLVFGHTAILEVTLLDQVNGLSSELCCALLRLALRLPRVVEHHVLVPLLDEDQAHHEYLIMAEQFLNRNDIGERLRHLGHLGSILQSSLRHSVRSVGDDLGWDVHNL